MYLLSSLISEFQNVWLWGFQQARRAGKCIWKLPAEPHQCDCVSGLLPHLPAGHHRQQPGARCASAERAVGIQHNQSVHTQPEHGRLLLHHLLRSFPSHHLLSGGLGFWFLYVQSGPLLHQPHHVCQQLHTRCCLCWQVCSICHSQKRKYLIVHINTQQHIIQHSKYLL